MRKAKNFTSSPFSIYIIVLTFKGWFQRINPYAAFLTDFAISASFRKATFLINSFKISRRYKGIESPTATSTLEGMDKFCEAFSNYQLSELTVDTILDFLNQLTDGCKPQTKRVRYTHLAAFFYFVLTDHIDHSKVSSNINLSLFLIKKSYRRGFQKFYHRSAPQKKSYPLNIVLRICQNDRLCTASVNADFERPAPTIKL